MTTREQNELLTQTGSGTQMPDYYAHLPENKIPKGRALVPITPDGRSATAPS